MSTGVPMGGGVITGRDGLGNPIVTYYAQGPQQPAGGWFNVWDYWQETDQWPTLDHALMFNRAIAAATATGNGGFIYAPGQYTVNSSIIVNADNVQIVGDGRSTQLVASATFPSNAPMIWYQAPASGFRQGARVRDLLLTCTGPSGVVGIQLDSTYYAVIERVDIEGIYSTSVYLNGSSSYFGAYTTMRDCHIGAVPGGGGSAGTGILSRNHEHWTVDHCTINWFNGAGGVGVKDTSSACSIQNCHFDECDTAVWLFFCQLARVSNNNFDRGLTRMLYLNGCNNSRIIGNDFDTFSGTGSQDALYLDNNAADNLIAHNNWQPGTGWTNAIHDNANTGKVNYYTANDVGGLAVIQGKGVYRANAGWNPRGASVSQLAVAASGTALTNTTGCDCTLLISGGTVTAVAIGGTTVTGQTSGWFRVPANQTVTVTYSVAPTTFQWFGD